MFGRRHVLKSIAASCSLGVAAVNLPKIAFGQTHGRERFIFLFPINCKRISSLLNCAILMLMNEDFSARTVC